MTPQQQTQPGRAAATATTQNPVGSAPSSEFEKLLAKDSKPCEFIPFGGQDKIKLTVAIVKDLIAVPTKSGKTCSDRDAKRFIMMCLARRLNPFEGDAFLIGYDTQNGPQFSLITAHQAFLKRAEVHPEYDGMRSGIILLDESTGEIAEREGDFHLGDERVVGGWAEVHFKNRKIPTKRTLRLERFNSGFAQWKVDPAGMIVKCAEADSLRSSFPTMVGGLYLNEEVQFMPDAPAMSKPLFEAGPATATATPRTHKPAEGDTAAAPNEPKFDQEQPPQAESDPPPPEPEEPRPLKQLRFALRASSIKEAALMEYWTVTGATDGSQSTLEEVFLAVPTVVTSTVETFPAIAEKIKEMRGAR